MDEQIAILKDRGMQFSDQQRVKEYLADFTYYSIVNGYSGLFWESDDKCRYKSGTRFSELKALHHFDENLRRELTYYVLQVENKVRSHIVYRFCDARLPDGSYRHLPDDYLTEASFDPARTKDAQTLIRKLKETIKQSKTHNGPVKHYLEQYKSIPLWVLATQMSFGETALFYHCLLPAERNAVAREFGLHSEELEGFLTVLKDFRNSIAHSNRVYCFKTVHRVPKVLKPNGGFDQLETKSNTRFGSVLFVLSYLLGPKDFKCICNLLSNLLIGLSKRLKTITILDVVSEMGVPQSMRCRFAIKLEDKPSGGEPHQQGLQ